MQTRRNSSYHDKRAEKKREEKTVKKRLADRWRDDHRGRGGRVNLQEIEGGRGKEVHSMREVITSWWCVWRGAGGEEKNGFRFWRLAAGKENHRGKKKKEY